MSQTWPKDIGSRMENFHGTAGNGTSTSGCESFKEEEQKWNVKSLLYHSS